MSTTAAGHDSQAVALLAGALTPYVRHDPGRVAIEVFAILHDAGIRLVPRSDPAAADIGKFRADASDTSRLAALRTYPRTGTARCRVLEYLTSHTGATDEEIQVALRMNANTERPRRVELVEGGWVRDSGARRPSSSGAEAIVWTTEPEYSGALF